MDSEDSDTCTINTKFQLTEIYSMWEGDLQEGVKFLYVKDGQ